MSSWANWSGSVTCSPSVRHSPTTLDALCDVVAKAEGPVRVEGAGHSFAPLVDTEGTLISLENLTGVIDVDVKTHIAEVWAGTPIRELGVPLKEFGVGLHNQGDIDVQTIAGAISTGTHGTGETLGNLSSMVIGLTIVDAAGNIIEIDRDQTPDLFKAARVSFGALGVIAKVKLAVRPAYNLLQREWRMSFSECASKIEELKDLNRNFEFFWFPASDELMCKSLNETAEQPMSDEEIDKKEAAIAVLSDRAMTMACEVSRFLPFMSAWFQRKLTASHGGKVKSRPSHRAYPSIRNVRFNEMEYAVPAERGMDCAREIVEFIRKSGENCTFPIEYRYVAPDDIWLSPFFMRESVTISVHQYAKQPYDKLFAGCERIFRKHNGRPHWGKHHRMTARDLSFVYPNWVDFLNARKQMDPDGKFLTPYLRDLLGIPVPKPPVDQSDDPDTPTS